MGLQVLDSDFASRITTDYRLRRMLHDIVPGKPLRGLEIGALSNPIASPEQAKMEYVDYAPTASLQQLPHRDTVKRNEIVNVDHVWPGSGSLAKVCGRSDYDFVLASHVIEHVPNVLGWFRGIHDVLRPGGVFNLAIPDRRFTFDFARKPSSLGEMMEADVLGYERPSIRQMFDHTYEARAIDPGSVWSGTERGAAPRYSGESALSLAMAQMHQIVDKNQYFDSHCWVLTPKSFIDCILGATEVEMFSLTISDFAPTRIGDFEFFVSFRRDDTVERSHKVDCLKHVRNTISDQNKAYSLIAEA